MCSLIAAIVLAGSAHSQDLTVVRGGEQLPAQLLDAGEQIWLVQMDGKNFFILPQATLDSLTKQIQLKDALIERHETVIAAQDSLIDKYEAYQTAADAHVDTLQQAVVLADSLFNGYKLLYNDLKSVIGLNTFSIFAGLGTADLPDSSLRLVGSAGVGYEQWWGQVQVGDGYRSLTVGLRVQL